MFFFFIVIFSLFLIFAYLFLPSDLIRQQKYYFLFV